MTCHWILFPVSGVRGFTFIFEAAGSWLYGIPDLNLLESGVSRNWETAQMCEVRYNFWIDRNRLKGRVCVCPLPFFSLLSKYNQMHETLHSQFSWGSGCEGWFLAALLSWWCHVHHWLTEGRPRMRSPPALHHLWAIEGQRLACLQGRSFSLHCMDTA